MFFKPDKHRERWQAFDSDIEYYYILDRVSSYYDGNRCAWFIMHKTAICILPGWWQ